MFPLINNRMISIAHDRNMALSLTAAEYSDDVLTLSIMRKRDKVCIISEVKRGCVMNNTDERIEIKSILVAVDGSEYSLKAVRYACAMGPLLGADVVLLHVVPMLVSATPYHDTVSDQPFLALQKVGEDILARAKAIANDCNCQAIDLISHGDPASKIIDIASERNTDLIIIGSRGVSGIRRLFVGSISTKVARQAHCPVMIVR